MTPFWILLGALVLGAVLGLSKWLGRFLRAFALAFAVGLFLHFQTNPAEALQTFAALGAGWYVARKVRIGRVI